MYVYNAHEPKVVGHTRLVTIIILLAVFAAFFYFQLRQLLYPVYTIQTQVRNRLLPLPTIVLEGGNATFSGASATLETIYFTQDGVKITKATASWLSKVEYGSNVVSTSNPDQQAFKRTKEGKVGWRIDPNTEVKYKSGLPGSDKEIQRMQLGIKLSVSTANLTATNSYPLSIFIFPYVTPDQPVDVSAQGWQPPSQIKIQTLHEMAFRTTLNVDSKGVESTDFDSYASDGPIPPDVGGNPDFLMTLVPTNTPSDDQRTFVVNTNVSVNNFTILNFLSAIGGAFTICITVYNVLFGIDRLAPWGILQRYILRRSILDRISPDTVEVRSPEDRLKRMSQGERKGFGAVNTYTSESDTGLVADLRQRTSELEAFQDRVESFYLDNSIFDVKPTHKTI